MTGEIRVILKQWMDDLLEPIVQELEASEGGNPDLLRSDLATVRAWLDNPPYLSPTHDGYWAFEGNWVNPIGAGTWHAVFTIPQTSDGSLWVVDCDELRPVSDLRGRWWPLHLPWEAEMCELCEEAGDLYCSRCGSAQDRAEDEWEDDAGYYYDPFDPDPYDNILVIKIKEDLDDKN